MSRRTIEQILNKLPIDTKNSLAKRPCWLLSTKTVFPETLFLPKIKPIVSSVALNQDRPEFVEVATNLDEGMDGLTAVVLADALNRKINSKVVAFLSEDTPESYELVIVTEKLRQVVESNGLEEIAATAANHDLIRALLPAILAGMNQDGSPIDYQELQQRAGKSVKEQLDKLLKGK